MADYFVRLVQLPLKVEGVTVPNNDGTFSIYINALLPRHRQNDVLEHELRHISSEHFYLDMPVAHMERQARGEEINLALHPPAGQLVHFYSEQALLDYLRRLSAQSGAGLF